VSSNMDMSKYFILIVTSLIGILCGYNSFEAQADAPRGPSQVSESRWISLENLVEQRQFGTALHLMEADSVYQGDVSLYTDRQNFLIGFTLLEYVKKEVFESIYLNNFSQQELSIYKLKMSKRHFSACFQKGVEANKSSDQYKRVKEVSSAYVDLIDRLLIEVDTASINKASISRNEISDLTRSFVSKSNLKEDGELYEFNKEVRKKAESLQSLITDVQNEQGKIAVIASALDNLRTKLKLATMNVKNSSKLKDELGKRGKEIYENLSYREFDLCKDVESYSEEPRELLKNLCAKIPNHLKYKRNAMGIVNFIQKNELLSKQNSIHLIELLLSDEFRDDFTSEKLQKLYLKLRNK
jgi:hypothetical protein